MTDTAAVPDPTDPSQTGATADALSDAGTDAGIAAATADPGVDATSPVETDPAPAAAPDPGSVAPVLLPTDGAA